MARFRNIRNFATIIVILPALAGCISGVTPPDSYTDRNGKTTVFQTDAELCVQSCNDDYDRCMDAPNTGRNIVSGPDSNLYGTNASCHGDLKTCLDSCKGR